MECSEKVTSVSDQNRVQVTMDEEDSDWKLEKVKVESELMPDENDRTEDYSSDVKDNNEQNPSTVLSTSLGDRSAFQQEKICVKTEDALKEELSISQNVYQQYVDHSSFSENERGTANQEMGGAETDKALSSLMYSCFSHIMPIAMSNSASYPLTTPASSFFIIQNPVEVISNIKPLIMHPYFVPLNANVQECVPSNTNEMQSEFVNYTALGTVKEEIVAEPDIYIDEVQVPAVKSVSSKEHATPQSPKIQGILNLEPHSKFELRSNSHSQKGYRRKDFSRTHFNKRGFSCDECCAQFREKHHLERHLLIHSNARAYACNQCSARFPRKSNLQTHIRSHSNERSFSCNQCPFKFKSNYSLKRHLLNHSEGTLIRYKQHSKQHKRKPRRDTVQYGLVQCSLPTFT